MSVSYAKDIAISVASLGANSIAILFWIHHERWSRLLYDITNFHEFGKPPGFDKVQAVGNKMAAFAFWYCEIGIVAYALAIYSDNKCQQEGMCGTYSPIWVPFDYSPRKIKVLITLAQMIFASFQWTAAMNTAFLSLECTEFMIAHLNAVKDIFIGAFSLKDEEKIRERLRTGVRYHNYTINLANQMNVLLKGTFGISVLISPLIFGSIGNQIAKDKSPGAFSFFFGYASGVLLMCHAGQRLYDVSVSVTDSIYGSKWYEADVKFWKDIVFISARCQIPLKMNSFPVGNLSYALFAAILKTSYSYLTLLNNNS